MRLHVARPAVPRAWTVELRSQGGQMVLTCLQCPLSGRPVAVASARSAALAHLARHARGDLRASHLRTCHCHERGCRWHHRHRGCAGPIRLLLASERGGRVWRLADACGACAAATAQAAVVPDTVLAGPPGLVSAQVRRPRRPRGPGERVRVGEILSYLAAALPVAVSAEGRLLALQCALRMNACLWVQLPTGMFRGLGINRCAFQELEQARWLTVVDGRTCAGVTAGLHDVALLSQPPAGPDRRRAADWALRNGSPARVGSTLPLLRLLGVYLAAHSDTVSGSGLEESEAITRDCGMRDRGLLSALNALVDSGLLEDWGFCPHSGDVRWTLAQPQR